MQSRGLLILITIATLAMAASPARAEEPPKTQPRPAVQPVHGAGIGVILGEAKDTGQVYIQAVAANSPAEKAGLRTGDIITQVDQLSVIGKTRQEVASLLQGNPDTLVTLTYLRKTDPPRYLTLIRAPFSQFVP
jgi:C-terminal processing protease CtpA/Prc